MGCCPSKNAESSAATQASSDEAPSSVQGGDSDILPGESVECYGKNAPNPSGLHDDASSAVNDKIENNHITIDCNLKTNTVFALTKNSTRTATSWEMTVLSPPGNVVEGLTFSGNTLSGTCADSTLNKSFKVSISAKDAAGVIDTRSFVFAPAKCTKSSVRFVHPLPGSVVGSPFGLRMHPIHKVMKPHTGIDLRFADRSVADVVAACDGEVTFAGNTGNGYGIAVKIKHLNEAGKHLCTTTYNHLAKVYVARGQKVAANQKVGREGTTGASTGNHLHFEVRLPNNTPVDPMPYIRGEVKSAGTKPSGETDMTNTESSTSNANLTPANVDAKMAECSSVGQQGSPGGDDGTTAPGVDDGTTPSDIDDPFELAWFYTMKREVGPFWSTTPQTSPTDPDILAGKIDTPDQQRRCGYSNHRADKGGITKFGVAQKMNRQLNVPTLDYARAKNLGFNTYWKANSPGKPKLLAIMCFDITYLCGPGGCRTILAASGARHLLNPGATKKEQLDDCVLIRDAQIKYHLKKIAADRSQAGNKNGWINRANATYAYVASLK